MCLQILHTGEISEQAPIPAVTESVLRSNELREGTTVSLDQQVTCSVAFAKGQERRVFFAIQGLPQVCIRSQNSSLSCHIFILCFTAHVHLPTLGTHRLVSHCHSVPYSLQLIAKIESVNGVQAHRYLTLVEGTSSAEEGGK